MSTKEDRIEKLQLIQHPEGGWFRETYCAQSRVEIRGESRAASTAIYFLLGAGEVSTFHRIDSDELWHHYEGSALRVHILDDTGYKTLTIGSLGTPDALPQGWVPAGAWFGAEVLEPTGYSLVGCTVAPGFDFAHFELAERSTLTNRFPSQAELIARLTPKIR